MVVAGTAPVAAVVDTVTPDAGAGSVVEVAEATRAALFVATEHTVVAAVELTWTPGAAPTAAATMTVGADAGLLIAVIGGVGSR